MPNKGINPDVTKLFDNTLSTKDNLTKRQQIITDPQLHDLLLKMSRGPKKFSDEEQELRNIWNTQQRGELMETEGGPIFMPEHPSMFKGEPTIVGKELGNYAKRFFSIAPNLKNRTPRIMYGPGSPAIDVFQTSGGGLTPLDFGRANLLGATKTSTGEININPSLSKDPAFLRHFSNTAEYGDSDPEQVLGHELTHAAGYMGESMPNHVMELIKKLVRK